MTEINNDTNHAIPPIPYKEAWQPEDKVWLKERKSQLKIYREKNRDWLKTYRTREDLKAERHFFLTGELPEEAGLLCKDGRYTPFHIQHILLLHPIQTIEAWVAIFEWAFEYEKIRYNKNRDEIKIAIAYVIELILYDKDGLYHKQAAKQLHQLAYGKQYRPEPFKFEKNQFYGCPCINSNTHPIVLTYANGYFYDWMVRVESYFTSEKFEPTVIPILEDLDYLQSCLPYVDKSRFDFMTIPVHGKEIERNYVLTIMHLVYFFINPRAPIEEETEEKCYAVRLMDFFENRVPNKLNALWEFIKNEQQEVNEAVEIGPGEFVVPAEDEEGEEPHVFKLDRFNSLSYNEIILKCEINKLSKPDFFQILHQCIADLKLTYEEFDSQKISLLNIKGLGIDAHFIKSIGYKKNQPLPAWRYQVKADSVKLLNIHVPVIIEVFVVFSKENPKMAMVNIHQKPVTPFLFKQGDCIEYGRLMSGQLKRSLLLQTQFVCTEFHEEADNYELNFYIGYDLIGQSKYDFPAFKSKNMPVWE